MPVVLAAALAGAQAVGDVSGGRSDLTTPYVGSALNVLVHVLASFPHLSQSR